LTQQLVASYNQDISTPWRSHSNYIRVALTQGYFFINFMENKTAILIDIAFLLRRLKIIYPAIDLNDPIAVADQIYQIAELHLNSSNGKQISQLYRIFIYDCPPTNKKAHYPISHQPIDFAKTEQAKFRNQLHEVLKRKRKVAIRLGHLSKHSDGWQLKPQILKRLLKKEILIDDLQDSDFNYDIRQKGVDMKIGIDIASLAYKKLVNQIILIAGDADFISAIKLARQEGIDFILDPLWSNIDDRLYEHTDGIYSVSPQPQI